MVTHTTRGGCQLSCCCPNKCQQITTVPTFKRGRRAAVGLDFTTKIGNRTTTLTALPRCCCSCLYIVQTHTCYVCSVGRFHSVSLSFVVLGSAVPGGCRKKISTCVGNENNKQNCIWVLHLVQQSNGAPSTPEFVHNEARHPQECPAWSIKQCKQ